MSDDERRVMPREALKAERVTSYLGESWSLGFHRTLFTDDEFDAAYYPAELLDALLDAVEAIESAAIPAAGYRMVSVANLQRLDAAFRAVRAA